ncbi:uncharacterized protein A4U43_C08F29800 [Asparagus officinalis]|nr:uncharacterized protein A4U43_C08F29800 [Asparagus officinalis]
MVDYAMAIHKNLYHTEEVPQGQICNPRRAEVVSRLKSKEESAAPLISFLQNSSYVQEHKADKQYNIQMLNDRFKIEALYHEMSLSVHWGKLAAEILIQNWDEALEELNRLKEIIDSKGDSLCPSFPLHCIKR